MRWLYLAYIALDMPMRIENIQGPARSPTVFDTLSPDSAKAEAHWLIACSDAPAQTIIKIKSQNRLLFNSPRIPISCPSSVSARMGTRENRTAFITGTAAQRRANTRQLFRPAV